MTLNSQITESPSIDLGGGESVIAFNVELSGMVLFPPASFAFHKLLAADYTRALKESGILAVLETGSENNSQPRASATVIALGSFIYGAAIVSDWCRGLEVQDAELKRMGLFQHAETGWYSGEDLIWRRHNPPIGDGPFIPKFTEHEKHKVNKTLLETVMFIVSTMQDPPKP